jgi:hypothetical protein
MDTKWEASKRQVLTPLLAPPVFVATEVEDAEGVVVVETAWVVTGLEETPLLVEIASCTEEALAMPFELIAALELATAKLELGSAPGSVVKVPAAGVPLAAALPAAELAAAPANFVQRLSAAPLFAVKSE